MELITTYRFKWNGQYIGIVSKVKKIIRTTPFPQHAIHHSADEFDWVTDILKDKGFDFTFEKLTHFYSPLKNDR
jgi:hypothetical protein